MNDGTNPPSPSSNIIVEDGKGILCQNCTTWVFLIFYNNPYPN